MSHKRPASNADLSDRRIVEDRDALQAITEEDLPGLAQVVTAAREHESNREKGNPMKKLFARHPVLAPAGVAVAVLLAVMFVPVSFDRTVGHDFALSVQGPGLGQAALKTLATEMKSQLGDEPVRVISKSAGGSPEYTLKTYVPAQRGVNPERVAEAFRDMLRKQGFVVTASVSPRMERVSSPAVAYAAGQIIRISVDGKSSSQIESEILSALQGEGFGDVQVSVTDRPEGGREIKITAEREADGQHGEIVTELEGDMPEIVLERGGQPIDGSTSGMKVGVRKMADDSGNETLVLDVTADGNTGTATVQGVQSMSDYQLQSEVESQLRGQGLGVTVEVTDGHVQVRPR